MGNVPNLRLLTQCVYNHTMEDMDVLRDAGILLVISNDVDSHFLILGFVL